MSISEVRPSTAPRSVLRRRLHVIGAAVVILAFVSPIYLMIVNAFKTQAHILPSPEGLPLPPTLITIEVFRHYGLYPPPVEVQAGHIALAHDTLRKIGIEPVHVSNGVTNQGGTPAHQWLEVTAYGNPTGIKIVAADEAEANQGLDGCSRLFIQHNIPREALSVVRPEGWPFKKLFGL